LDVADRLLREATVPRSWILQGSPSVWDVWTWWELDDEELDGWTIAVHLDRIRAGDNFALWLGGKDPGVYAVGKVTSDAYGPFRPSGGHWIQPPDHDVWGVDLETTKYLFDHPIPKSELVADTDFSNALILRMPRSPNPIALEPGEWQAIRRRTGRGRQPQRPVRAQPVVTARPLGSAHEDVTVATTAQERNRVFREARLVKRFEKFLGRQLMARTVLLPSGERLVCDAYDDKDDLLIEAKASTSRQDVRMAIGQLMDYRRYLAPKGRLAVMLPQEPTADILDLLHGLKIRVIVQKGSRFIDA
jgi:hypothetical protein